LKRRATARIFVLVFLGSRRGLLGFWPTAQKTDGQAPGMGFGQ